MPTPWGRRNVRGGQMCKSIPAPVLQLNSQPLTRRFPRDPFSWLIASLHQLLSYPAPRQQCSYLRERHCSHQPFGSCLPPGALPATSTASGSHGWAVILHVEKKVCCQPLRWDGKDRPCQLLVGKEKGRVVSLNTSIRWLDDHKLSAPLMS